MADRRWISRFFAACAIAALAALPLSAAPAHADAEKIELDTKPLIWNPEDRTERQTGELTWAGGIEIKSPNKKFGGWSGLAVNPDGTALLAVSDEGQWFTAQILYDERDRLSGLVEGRMAPMLGLDGEHIAGKALGDAESLVIDTGDPLNGSAYVGFERAHRIWRYDLAKDGFAALPEQLLTQRHFGRLNTNGGIEALELLPATKPDGAQRILAITEDTLDPRGNIKAFIADGHKISWFAVRPIAPYKPTDAALLPNGDLLLLERRFSMLGGVGMQMRLIKGDDIRPDAIVDGKVIIDVGQRYSIDNMEGLAVRQDNNGDLVVYVISDDNFNPVQKTVLLMFRLRDETSSAATHDETPTLRQSLIEGERSGEASGSAGAATLPN